MSHVSKNKKPSERHNEAMRASAKNLRRRSHEAKSEAMRASAKNLRRRSQAPTLELRLFEFSSRGHQKSSTPGGSNDSRGYCRPSLGLGNTSQSRDPRGRRLGSTKNRTCRRGPMIVPPTVGPLWGSEIPARAEILGGDVWGAPKTQHTGRGQ